ncbi:MAG: HAD family phosphatase, partial [Pedobacter sp.]|nr:HAD family phosphatase [Chitinophagaceae bacterium]
MQPIKNIIFDLGGIFLDIHYHLTKDAFINLGIKNFDDLFTQHHANDLFEDLETGKISENDFYDLFRKEANINLSNEQIKKAWNALLGSFPLEKLKWLKDIKQKYNIYLFSNTNQIHYDAFMKIYEAETGKNDFNQHFIKAYYSQNIGLRKPYPESFLYIINEQN